MLGLDLAMTDPMKKLVRGRMLSSTVGVLAGASLMIANAAGPMFGVYLLQMGLIKAEFVGTRSWFFLVINLAKMPFAFGLGLVNVQSLSLNALYLPIILAGAVSGYAFLKYINIQVFGVIIRVAVLVAAARLIFT